MFQFDLTAAEWTQHRISAPEWPSADSPKLQNLQQLILGLHKILPIQWVKLTANNLPYKFEIKFNDGRAWTNDFHDAATISPRISYLTSALWRVTEVTPISAVMEAILVFMLLHSPTSIDMRPR